MPTPILMPALSPTMEEGKLAKWHVKVGDKVKSGDIIAEIETDKATMEVEAVDEGVVAELVVAEGAEGVKVNAVIAQLRDENEKYVAGAKPAAASAPSLQHRVDARNACDAAAAARSEVRARVPPAVAAVARRRVATGRSACSRRRWRGALRRRAASS